jgi:hypothetical protein
VYDAVYFSAFLSPVFIDVAGRLFLTATSDLDPLLSEPLPKLSTNRDES